MKNLLNFANKTYLKTCDFLVIGGGTVGLSVARSLNNK